MSILAASNAVLPIPTRTDFQSKLETLPPLVTLGRVKLHLRILEAFRGYVQKINGFKIHEDASTGDIVMSAVAQEFMQTAFTRFKGWIDWLGEASTSDGVLAPPPDVLMVWHSYMMNPRAIFEDSQSNFPQLQLLLNFPVELIVEHIDCTTKTFRKQADHIARWESSMNCAYDILENHPFLQKLPNSASPICPQCSSRLQTLKATLYETAPSNGSVTCDSCGLSVTHDSFCVGKLIHDLSRYVEKGTALPGTLLDLNGYVDVKRSQVVAGELIRLLGDLNQLGSSVEWKMTHVATKLLSQPSMLRASRIGDILTPYTYLSPFSIDLLKSLSRQMHFAHEIFSVWSTASLASDEEVEEIIVTYHRFLELLSVTHHGSMSPTLLIDLIWHTHQLNGTQYRANMLTLFGQHLDHRDNQTVDSRDAANQNRITQWKIYFGDAMASQGSGEPKGPSPTAPTKPPNRPPQKPVNCGVGPSATQDMSEDDIIVLECTI